jgi:hypothetical protein
MRSFRYLLPAVLAYAVAATAALAQPAAQPQRYTVPLSRPGQPVQLEVSLISGSIVVEAYAGAEVVIEAVGGDEDRRGGGAPPGMRRLPNRSFGIVVEEQGNEVKVGMGGMPADVTLRIQVPRQTSAQLATVNGGDIVVKGLDGVLELQNTNGGISALEVSGSVVANTTNGDVKVSLVRVNADSALSFVTFNGDVDVSLPAATRGDVRMRSDNGEIYTDFDLQVSAHEPKVEQRRAGGRYRLEIEQDVHGTMNGGGREIQLRTFNGDIYLRRRG